ncbi:MAG: bifunctional ADP-heptose synthase [Bacteroidia bacterium]
MNRQELQRIFQHFKSLKVLIIGDVMVDSYIFGKVERISPEAPVPVVHVISKEKRLGGAANVARNIKALGATPILSGTIGKDKDGDEFLLMLADEGLSISGMIRLDRPTTVKTRIIGNKHQLLRVDEEVESPLNKAEATHFNDFVLNLLKKEQPNAVIFEDYDKGLIDENLISSVVKYCSENKIQVAADPKSKNFMHYKGVDLFKPNLKEINEGLKTEVDASSDESIKQADQALRQQLKHSLSLITLSEHGLVLTNGQEYYRIPAEEINIADVSGAGDTVISTATLCLVSGIDPKSIAQISNLAGASVCERVGVVPVNASELFDNALIALTDSVNNE